MEIQHRTNRSHTQVSYVPWLSDKWEYCGGQRKFIVGLKYKWGTKDESRLRPRVSKAVGEENRITEKKVAKGGARKQLKERRLLTFLVFNGQITIIQGLRSEGSRTLITIATFLEQTFKGVPCMISSESSL